MTAAPIAAFVYNRPAHARRMFDSLRADPLAAGSRLTVFSDGPKKPEHASAVAEVRTLVRQLDGFASVRLVERPENLGLARSMAAGVEELCRTHGNAIVLEDDLVVAPGFLAFLNQALLRYAGDARVMQISGYQFPGRFGGGKRAVFLPIISCWGWATWDRAWRHYDPSAAGAARLDRDADLQHRFNLHGAYDYYGMLQDQRAGKIDSWGVRWLLSVFLHDGLVLYPPATLVENTGVDGSGTHGAGTPALQTTPLRGSTEDWELPDRLELDAQALEAVRTLLRSQRPSLLQRMIRKLVT